MQGRTTSEIHFSGCLINTTGLLMVFWVFFVFLFAFSRAAPTAYGGSQARSLIGAIAASLHQSHSNARSKPYLLLTPQLTALLDP